VKESRSRTVIARRAGTVSVSGPSMRRKTRRFAISGSQRSAGASSVRVPSSTSIMTALAVTAFVIEAMRKIVSRRMGALPSMAVTPTASAATSSPCATSQTAPGNSCRVTRAAIGSRRETTVPCNRRPFVHAPMAAAATAEPDTRRNSRLFMVMDSVAGRGHCQISPQLTALFTSAPIIASSSLVNSFSAKEVGHMAPSSRFASSLKPNVAYLDLNFCALWK
jgi:hypothetical protein